MDHLIFGRSIGWLQGRYGSSRPNPFLSPRTICRYVGQGLIMHSGALGANGRTPWPRSSTTKLGHANSAASDCTELFFLLTSIRPYRGFLYSHMLYTALTFYTGIMYLLCGGGSYLFKELIKICPSVQHQFSPKRKILHKKFDRLQTKRTDLSYFKIDRLEAVFCSCFAYELQKIEH